MKDAPLAGNRMHKLTGSMTEYKSLSQPYNEAARPGNPLFFVMPRTENEVLDAVRWAIAAGFSISIHATGHDFEGRSLDGDIIINMGRFRKVSFDSTTQEVTIGGGARVSDINYVLEPLGRAISTGTNQDVGVAGLALGGGAAYTSRQYGLTCDALVEVVLCTFAGELMTVNDDTNPPLMRLLRGAGGGLFGVIISMTFQTYKAEPVTMFRTAWNLGTGLQLLPHLEELLISAPNHISMRIGANVSKTDTSGVVTLSGQMLRGAPEALTEYMGSIAQSTNWTQSTVPYRTAMAGAIHETAGGSFKIKSRFSFSPIGLQGIEELAQQLRRWPSTHNPDGAGFAFFAWGGMVKEFSKERSFVPGRQADYLASFDTSWTPLETELEVAEQLIWLDQMDEIGSRHLSQIAYINFPDSDGGAFESRHYGTGAITVRKMRQTTDPYGVGRQDSRCDERKCKFVSNGKETL